ncbi:heme A synthase [Aliiglaciecola sp. M165]|uniref:COX15/CtaA family protein n=1 Tax=Aliiglaciecola sp. M165 TaxID=2593649 RepID=UPI00117C1E8C|nr:COX15/CtaA family protein [Aliiglaciecola sp. M165]TRY33349.1 heme A synthase [Aliiglaciecola sp. M165]
MRKLVLVAVILAIVVIVLGAYTRLTDAGLGCPDWPGCYGHLTVPKTDSHIAAAESAFPERPFEAHKAWNEMIHRYAAGALGLVILAIFIVAFAKRTYHSPVKLPFFLLCLVIFQAALGMWTVTMDLMPVVVMGHLLGGFSVIACLYLLYLRLTPYRIPGGDAHMSKFAKYCALGIVILVGQIALGGWTSANYAALACTEFPFCEGDWAGKLDIPGAFSVPPAENYEFGVHDWEERMTMHVAHRIGAIITFIYLCWLSIRLYANASSQTIKNLAVGVVLVLGLQVMLGVSNVVFSLPLAVAVMHNAVAAGLLLIMVKLCYTLYRKI